MLLPLNIKALFEFIMRLFIFFSIFTICFFSGCLDFGNDEESDSAPSTGESAFDRNQRLKELELQIESLKWENTRLSLKLKTVDGSALVMDKRTGLWHYDVERVPFSGRASEVFPDGSPRGEADFYKGRKDGMERFWWPNGKLKEEGHWFDGRANGVFKEWSNLGELEKVIRFKNGEIIEVILEKP